MRRHGFAVLVALFAAILVSLTAANQLAVMRSVDLTSHLANDALEAAVLGEIEAAVGLEGREVARLASGDYTPHPLSPGGSVLDAHPGIAMAFDSFDEAIAGFAEIAEEAEEDEVEELVEEHEHYKAAVIDFIGTLQDGGDAVASYGTVLLVEREVTAALLELREEEIGSLSSVVDSVRGAGSYLLWGIPALFLFAVGIAVFLGTQVRNRKKELDHAEQLSSLYDVGMRMTQTIDLEPMVATVAIEARRQFDADSCAALLFGGPGAPELHSISDRSEDDGTNWDLESLAARLAESTSATTERNAGTSRLLAPLLSDGLVFGVVAVQRSARFSDTELTVFDMLTSQAGLALRNARLYADVERGHRELRAALDDLKATQTQLLQAQRLESIGELAAGIAHEINTPIQYIGDNAHFLGDGFTDLLGMQSSADALAEAVKRGDDATDALDRYELAAKEADIEFLRDEIPKSVTEVGDGVARVSEIVRALKDFSHPGSDVFAPVDINRAIENTLIVTRNQWAEFAEAVTDLGEGLASVPVLSGPFNQALLNIVVNAAQAIADVGSPDPGMITVATSIEGDHAEIAITDTGSGIPPEIQDRVFDPFFTTREVGDGTGQGLSIARSVIVDQHGGELTFTTETGKGTTFMIRLPLAQDVVMQAGLSGASA